MKVSVVTPTLNGVDYLGACIESAQRNARNGIEVEHIIVDAGSTDGTVELARALGATVLQGKDRGIFDAINKGSFASSGELLGFLGADDVLLDGGLEAVAEAYRRESRPWVVGGIRWIDGQGRSLGGLAAPPNWMTPRMLICLGWNPVMHMATYISRDFYGRLGGFNHEFKDCGDYEMFCRALDQSPYARVRQPIACFRRTGQNNSASPVHRDRAQREIARVRAAYGPPSGIERMVWKTALKTYFNVRNPDWLLHKQVDLGRTRLRLQPHAHF